MLTAEYENWLMDETRRCSQMEAILRSSGEENVQVTENDEGEGVNQWFAEYCGSCLRELEGVEGGRGLAFT